MKYKIEKFKEPITKSYKDVKKYDVARFEYGDYDNWVNAIILSVEISADKKTVKTEFATIDGRVFVGHSFTTCGEDYFTIVGTATSLTKQTDAQK